MKTNLEEEQLTIDAAIGVFREISEKLQIYGKWYLNKRKTNEVPESSEEFLELANVMLDAYNKYPAIRMKPISGVE